MKRSIKRKSAGGGRVNVKLKNLNDRLNEAQSVGNIGNWEWILKSNKLFWSDHIYVIFGLEKKGFSPTYPRFLEHIHPDDRFAVENAVQESIRNHSPYEVRHRIITPLKEIRYVIERGRVCYDRNGKPLRMVGTVQDITEYSALEKANHIYEFIFQNSTKSILVTDVNSEVIFANKAAAKMWEYENAKEMLMQKTHLKNYWDKTTARNLENISKYIEKAEHEVKPFIGITKNKKRFYADYKISPIISESGDTTGYLAFFSEISQSYLNTLRKKEENKKLELLLSNVDALHYGVEVTGGKYMAGKVFYMSPNARKIAGITEKDVSPNGNLWSRLIHPEDFETLMTTTHKCVYEKVPLTRLFRLKNPSTGKYKWFEDKITPGVDENGNVTSYFGSARDVSERISCEKKLSDYSNKIHALLSNIDEVVFGFDFSDGKIESLPFYLSGRSGDLLGFNIGDLTNDPDLWISLVHPEDRNIIYLSNKQLVRENIGVTRTYRLFNRVSESYHWFEEKLSPYLNNNGEIIFVYGRARDITGQVEKRDQLKASESKLRTLFDNALAGIFTVKLSDGRLQEANITAVRFFGYNNKEEFLHQFNVLEHWADAVQKEWIMERLHRSGAVANERVQFRKKDKTFFWGNINAHINTKDNTIECVILDVTKFVDQEAALINSLKEKESLLQELHHRVKNNLQIVNSLIQLKYHRLEDEKLKEKLVDIKERIQVIAAIHESLYLGQNFSNVEFGKLLKRILNNVIQLHRETPIEVKLTDFAFTTSIEIAIPLGLLVYEILSNSFKHAFSRDRKNILSINISSGENRKISIEISDNGKGYFPDKIGNNSMGLKIVNNLVKQLHGELISFSAIGVGTTNRLIFPLK